MRLTLPLVCLLAACAAPAARVGESPKAPASAPSAGFIGTWAPRLEYCRDFPWTFEAGRLDAPGEVFCVYPTVTPTPAGYRLIGECSGEAARERDEVDVTMLAPDRMRIDAQVWHEAITLLRCPAP